MDIVLSRKEFKTPEEKLAFLMSFKDELVQLVTLEEEEKIQDLLYDLIKADIVEKVEE